MAEEFQSLALKRGVDEPIIRPIAIGPVVLAIFLFSAVFGPRWYLPRPWRLFLSLRLSL